MMLSSRRHHRTVDRSTRGLTTRRRFAQFVRETTQLLQFENKTAKIKGVAYTLEKHLGHGGQGAVFAARRSDGEQFAVKVFLWEESPLTKMRLKHPSAESFLKESLFMMRLSLVSRHFVKFKDVDVSKAADLVICYIVMELGTGDLSKMIQGMAARKAQHSSAQRGNSFTHGRDRKFVWRQLVVCTKALHRHKIVNTDLKPGNFITFGNEIKLSDFGAAINTHAPGKHYTGFGTRGWSAPEVLFPDKYSPQGNRASPKADIWSLGAILYYMTYGTLPVPTGHYEVGYSDASAPPPGKQRTRDPHLQNILQLTLQMNPANRPVIIQLERHPYTLSKA